MLLGHKENYLLAAVNPVYFNRWQNRLALVKLSRNQQLYSPSRSPGYVYFPTTSIVSLVSIT